ncbi:MAG: 50S ribosomal protein L28 [Candidatus Sumerlaeota bacterium]|nr:50S ribosomal protein L28 [Candidatus Sumerlaeota bacterium]
MAVCEFCGKKRQVGMNVSHAHNRTKRIYKPNVHRMRAKIDGTVRRVYICSSCLRAGRIAKA